MYSRTRSKSVDNIILQFNITFIDERGSIVANNLHFNISEHAIVLSSSVIIKSINNCRVLSPSVIIMQQLIIVV